MIRCIDPNCPSKNIPTRFMDFIAKHPLNHFSDVECPLRCGGRVSKSTTQEHLKRCPVRVYKNPMKEGEHFLVSQAARNSAEQHGECKAREKRDLDKIQRLENENRRMTGELANMKR